MGIDEDIIGSDQRRWMAADDRDRVGADFQQVYCE